MPVAESYNIIRKYLGNRGLRLNDYGASRVAMSYIATITKLWKSDGSLSCSFNEKATESSNKYVFKTFETTGVNCKDGPLEVLKMFRANNVNRIAMGNSNIWYVV